MRVAHLEFGRHLYGGARQVLYLADGLAEMGLDNLVYCAPGSAMAGAVRDTRATAVELAVGGDADLTLPWRIAQQLRRDHVDLVHVHSRRGADTFGGWAAGLARVPAVITRRVDNPETAWLARIKYARFAAVIGISREIVAMLEGYGLENVALIPSAVDTERFAPTDGDRCRRSISDRLGVAPNVPVVGMVAQFISRKGHRRGLEIFGRTRERVPDARLVLFGQGPLEAQVRERAEELGLSDAVIFAGLRTDLPELLPGLDVLLHPAEREGLGVALLESQSSGVPPLAARLGGMVDAIEHERTGLLLPLADLEHWSAALVTLLTDGARRRAMGEAGRRRMIDKFSIAAMVRRNRAVYDDVISR